MFHDIECSQPGQDDGTQDTEQGKIAEATAFNFQELYFFHFD